MSTKILIVDDNPNMSSLLAEMLEIFDCDSVRAGDGVEALEKIDQDEFNMVITDMRMPKMSGLDLMKRIKRERPNLPVVVISGYAVDDEGNSLLTDMADGFLNKPFKMVDIENILTKIVKQ